MTKKKILFILLTFLVFKCGFTVADEVKEPNIITINNQLLVYEEVAEKIIANAEVNGLNVKRNNKEVTIEVKGDNDLFMKVVNLRDNAKESGWVFVRCRNNKYKKNLGIELDKERNLITDITLCS